MHNNDISIAIVLVILILFWLPLVVMHYFCPASSKEAVVLPRPIAFLFGNFRKDGVSNFRAIFAQLTFGTFFIGLILIYSQLISFDQFFTIGGAVFLCMSVVFLFYVSRKG